MSQERGYKSSTAKPNESAPANEGVAIPALRRRDPMQPINDPMAYVRAERQEAAARIDRSLKAWRAVSGTSSGAAKIPSGGAPLPGEVRTRIEPHLGADLSGVKVSTSGESAQAAGALGAKAFTVGQDVHFGAGQYAPGTKEGDRLLAHELTHTVQAQKSGIQRKGVSVNDDAALEREADGMGARAGGAHEVSQPHEPAEKEADAVGDHVADKLHGGGKAEGGAKPAGAEKAPSIGAKLWDWRVLRKPVANATPRIFRKTAQEEAEALEKRDGGHSLGRHGPSVTDQQLKDRITTGVAPDKSFSPTGTSTKFASYEVYLETRAKAVTTLDSAITKTVTRLAGLLATLQKAEADHKLAKPGPDKGPTGKLGLAVAAAKKAVTDGCKTPPAGELAVKASLNQAKRVALANSYEVVVEHGKSVGSGFEGDGAAKTVTDPSGSGKTGVGATATKPIAKVTRCRSTFETGEPGLAPVPKAEAMKIAQHFPTTEAEGIS
jgi:hypothetical protein